MGIFKEYDIRGIYPNDINEDVAYNIGKSIGKYIEDKTVFVNHDTRKGSLMIKNSIIDGLKESGVNVIDLGLGPVMIPAFASFKEKKYGISITASHNPPEYTGVLLFKDGFSLSPKEVENIFNNRKFSEGLGSYNKSDYSRDYVDYILKGIDKMDIKVAIDTMGGATTEIVKEIFKGATFDMLNNSFSQDFFGKTPEPSEKNAQELIGLVKSGDFDFGVQFDGDGDRAIFIDENGNFVDTMIIALIFIKYFNFKRVVANVSCSSILEKYANVIYTPVGRPFIEKGLIDNNADFGVETSSHFYFGNYYPFSDGLLAAVLMSKLLFNTKKKLSQMVKEFPRVYLRSFSIRFDDEISRDSFMDKVKSQLMSLGSLNMLDGFKVMIKDGFILVRKSNTEPIIRVVYEGKDEQSLERIKQITDKFINYGGKLVS